MKILFFLDTFPALAQSYVLNQITGMIEKGHEVGILAAVKGDCRKVHADVEQYGLLDRVVFLEELPGNKIVRVAKGMVWMLGRGWKNPGVLGQSLNKGRFGRTAGTGELFYAVVSLLSGKVKLGAFDVVLCHFGPMGQLAVSLRELGLLKGKIATVFHGYDMSLMPHLYGDDIYRLLFARGDLFLPISENWKNKLLSMGCAAERIVVHHMGVSPGMFQYKRREIEKGGMMRIVSIARLSEKKGLRYGIEAAAKLLRAGRKVDYVIVGDGPLKGTLVNQIEEAGISQAVRLVGWKNQRELAAILDESHILLAPSVTDEQGNQEGIPVALMEAMCMGLPVVSTDHSGIGELVKDGQNGYLLPERDSEGLADKLSYMIEHRQNWVELGRAGREYVEKHFNIDLLNDRLEDLLSDTPWL